MEKYHNLFWPKELEKSAEKLHIGLPDFLKTHVCKILTDSMFNSDFFDDMQTINLIKTLATDQSQDMIFIADKSLLIAGMFPEKAKSMSISLAYLIDTSAIALNYASTSPEYNKKQRDLYRHLSNKTLNITDILMQTKENLSKNKTISIEDAVLLKKTHNSKYANSIIY